MSSVKRQRRERPACFRIVRQHPQRQAYPAEHFCADHDFGILGYRPYENAKIEAAGETDLDEAAFPEVCAWSVEQIKDPACWPDGES
jgi:hypothetical protein